MSMGRGRGPGRGGRGGGRGFGRGRGDDGPPDEVVGALIFGAAIIGCRYCCLSELRVFLLSVVPQI